MRLYVGDDPVTGKRIEPYGSRPTRKEAERLLHEFVVQLERGRVTRATVAQALDAWLETSDIEASTRQGYQGYIDRNLKPALGGLELSKVTVRPIEQFYADLRRCRERCDGRTGVDHACRPLAASTIKQIHAILSGAFDAAVRWEWMASNPARLAPEAAAACSRSAAADRRTGCEAVERGVRPGRGVGDAGVARDGDRDPSWRALRTAS